MNVVTLKQASLHLFPEQAVCHSFQLLFGKDRDRDWQKRVGRQFFFFKPLSQKTWLFSDTCSASLWQHICILWIFQNIDSHLAQVLPAAGNTQWVKGQWLSAQCFSSFHFLAILHLKDILISMALWEMQLPNPSVNSSSEQQYSCIKPSAAHSAPVESSVLLLYPYYL